ncbi:MAG: DUF1919 domain-containing protein [Lutibacter sp.]|uniref:DUF1919 domain-containing protein n=1 Tax=Lutibacter sp. TaxID=1925666 RepID=UPI0017B4F8A6|nr:DUF1919 domain-containing protein [Lutibacter sp.]MBT8316874.1 DUF1919 domain-containing protein [Lutibacter sp.]NNJ57734.1 DUF1919 domain-containing protein [Lutibacter sp.]
MIRTLTVFFKRKFRRIFKNQLSKKDIKLLKNKNFVIISNNCWGGEVYNWFKRPYNSPFVGLFLHGPCYIELLSHFDYYMSLDLTFVKSSKYLKTDPNYPVGKLNDIEIHFLHYKDEEEAFSKWERRKKRMFDETSKNNYFFKICDLNEGTEEIFNKFHKLPFKNKVSFSIHKFSFLKNKNHIKIKESFKSKGITVPNGVKLYKITFLYFDIPNWLNN